jgi:hypothetical protein
MKKYEAVDGGKWSTHTPAFGRPRVQISARSPAILSEGCLWFPQSL